MYRVIKGNGHNSTIVIENTDTHSSIIVGRLTTKILDLLKSNGYEVDTEDVKLTDEWNIKVDGDVAKELADMAMSMKKPIRDQRKSEKKVKENSQIDAMDVLLGLASYK